MTGKLANITREVLEPVWMRFDIPSERIAQRLGVTRAGLSWHAKKLGLPSRAGNQAPHKKGSDEEFRRLWLAGVSSVEIAKHLGASGRSFVSRRALMLGLPMRGRGNRGGFYGPDGQWRKHTPLAEVLGQDLEERLAAVMRRDAKGRSVRHG